MSIEQLYEQAMDSLAPADRLRLATMLLETVSPAVVIEDSEAWSEQDLAEYAAQSRRRVQSRLSKELGDGPLAPG